MSYMRLWKGLVLVAVTGTPLVIGTLAEASPREITDFEARKLTFSALTATPVVHHYRSHHHVQKRHYALAANRKVRRKTTIRTVTYRGRVVTHHLRNRHHRRG